MRNIVILNNSFHYYFPQKTILGYVLVNALHLSTLVLDFSQIILAVKTPWNAQYNNPKNSLNFNFPKNQSLRMSLLLLYTLVSLFGAGLQPDGPGCPNSPLDGQYNHPQLLINPTFPKNQSLGMSLLSPYNLVSLVLEFSPIVLAVKKRL